MAAPIGKDDSSSGKRALVAVADRLVQPVSGHGEPAEAPSSLALARAALQQELGVAASPKDHARVPAGRDASPVPVSDSPFARMRQERKEEAQQTISRRVVRAARSGVRAHETALADDTTNRVPKVSVEAERNDMQRLAELSGKVRETAPPTRSARVTFDPIDEEFFAAEARATQVGEDEDWDDLDTLEATGEGDFDADAIDSRGGPWFFFKRRRERA